MSLHIETQNKNAVNYRYGQDFTYDNVKFAWRRQGYANRLVVGVVDDAIGKGFNVIDTATKKPIEKNDQAREIIEEMWVDIKKTIYFDRAYGKSLGMFSLGGQQVPIWRAYDISHYFVSYDEASFPTKYTITNKVGGVEAKSFIVEVIDDELSFTYEILIREDVEKGEGISVVEPVWDTLFALSSLDEQGTYYCIRYGSGIRYMKIPQAKFADKVFMAKIMAMLKGAIGSNGVYALPYAMIQGVKEEFSIETESAVQINFTQLQDLLLTTLASQTGIPMEVWRGAMQGLRSSETNETRYWDYLQSVQDDYRLFFKWIVNKLNTFYNWYSESIIISIQYISRDSLSTEELIELTGKKVEIANKAGYKVPLDYLAGILEIPLQEKAIDPLGINNAGKKKEDGSDEEEEEGSHNSGHDDDDDDDLDECIKSKIPVFIEEGMDHASAVVAARKHCEERS